MMPVKADLVIVALSMVCLDSARVCLSCQTIIWISVLTGFYKSSCILPMKELLVFSWCAYIDIILVNYTCATHCFKCSHPKWFISLHVGNDTTCVMCHT